MKRVIGLVVLAVGCGGGRSTTAPAEIENQSTWPTLTQDGVGRITASTVVTRAAIQEGLPAPLVASERTGTSEDSEVRVMNGGRLAMVVKGDPSGTWRIEVFAPEISTDDGASIGTRWEELRKRGPLLCGGGPTEGDPEVFCWRGKLGYVFVAASDALGGGARLREDEEAAVMRGLDIKRIRWSVQPEIVDDSHMLEMSD